MSARLITLLRNMALCSDSFNINSWSFKNLAQYDWVTWFCTTSRLISDISTKYRPNQWHHSCWKYLICSFFFVKAYFRYTFGWPSYCLLQRCLRDLTTVPLMLFINECFTLAASSPDPHLCVCAWRVREVQMCI